MNPRSLPSPSALRRQQWKKQATKVTYRGLEDYQSYLESFSWLPTCSANRVLRQAGIKGTKQPMPLRRWPANVRRAPKLLELLAFARGGVWADFGCGLQLAQAEFARDHVELARDIQLVGVDYLDWSVQSCLAGIKIRPEDRGRVAQMRRAVRSSPATKILADLTTVDLPVKARLITSIEVIQYIEDKVAALCHWHNQLAVGGVALIATESSWMHWIRDHKAIFRDGAPARFLRSLRATGAEFGLYGSSLFGRGAEELDNARDAQLLVIHRRSAVELQSAAPYVQSWANPDGYLSSEYAPTDHYVSPRTAPASLLAA